MNDEMKTPEKTLEQKLTEFKSRSGWTKEMFEQDLKKDINGFLFERLPGAVTLEEMEYVACKIHDVIMEMADKFC